MLSHYQGPSKKRKLAPGKEEGGRKKKAAVKAKVKGKEKAADRPTIPIPNQVDDEDVELSDEDLDMLEEYGDAVSFLGRLDQKGIARSKKETERLHRLHKPARAKAEDDLPSVDSHDEDDEPWSSGVEDDDEGDDAVFDSDADSASASASSSIPHRKRPKQHPEGEMPYEILPRKRRASWEPESDKEKGIEHLPIKLADGRIQKSTAKIVFAKEQKSSADEEDQEETSVQEQHHGIEDVSTGARFGRPAVLDVVGNKSRKARIQGAKEQIAGICQEIVADPENSLGLLRRLHTFSLHEISTPSHPEPVVNDVLIRKLTIISQLAVFKDVIPGYRIRALTEKEKAEKVSQMVQRTREWEQGLVGIYQSYLRILETEIKAKSELAETALQCMCTLLVEVTHFNFRVNLMSTIVAGLSRKSWDKLSDLCLSSLVTVFRADITGEASLEVVRLLNRMIKERKFKVHPEVLSCLSHLRLKTELGVRASSSRADKTDTGSTKTHGREGDKGKGKAKRAEKPHLSKKARKALKERQEITKEMREAEAEVDKEERAATHTETLKLLFVLYFRVLKNPAPTVLLPAALRGIARFAHLVNIDFFKDLMQVLKDIMAREPEDDEDSADADTTQRRLQCIITAFELLSGQGEALDIDLTDFINALYALLPALALSPTIDTAPSPASPSTADLLFRALLLVFTPRSAGSTPPWRAAAFTKRLLGAALHWPPGPAQRALELARTLLVRDAALGALFSTAERAGGGAFRPELDDPQLCSPLNATCWEVRLLAAGHWDARVREGAEALLAAAV
ncbi:nucleolar complex-associated protein 3 [Amylocystis lapponica]|nr:nucleolar complex-associated protein 3 [Amylocystis lapponica]